MTGPYPSTGDTVPPSDAYPVQYDVEYPDRELNRLTTFFRIFTVIPIAIVLGAVSGTTYSTGKYTYAVAAGGMLIGGPLLMILFRKKYPRWWFDWNQELAAGCGLLPSDVVWVSAAKNVGIDRLRDLVRLWLS